MEQRRHRPDQHSARSGYWRWLLRAQSSQTKEDLTITQGLQDKIRLLLSNTELRISDTGRYKYLPMAHMQPPLGAESELKREAMELFQSRLHDPVFCGGGTQVVSII